VLDESDGSQLVKGKKMIQELRTQIVNYKRVLHETAENSGEVGFPCDFPGCNKRWETVYRLDCHKPTHIGWVRLIRV